jgi:hypothetical protein
MLGFYFGVAIALLVLTGFSGFTWPLGILAFAAVVPLAALGMLVRRAVLRT